MWAGPGADEFFGLTVCEGRCDDADEMVKLGGRYNAWRTGHLGGASEALTVRPVAVSVDVVARCL